MSNREVMQQALEALKSAAIFVDSFRGQKATQEAITALEAALAQPEQEPVAWAVQGCSKMWRGEFAEIDAKAEAKRIGGTCVAYALYTTPPAAQRPWVGLTEKEFLEACQLAERGNYLVAFQRIQIKLKEKNT
jgi:hypothetical protein